MHANVVSHLKNLGVNLWLYQSRRKMKMIFFQTLLNQARPSKMEELYPGKDQQDGRALPW